MSWSAFRAFTDPDAYYAGIRGTHADGVLAARGDFRADLTTIELDRVSLQHARETLPRTAYSVVDPRWFNIAFATDPRQQIYVNGLELVPDAIVVFRAASEGHNRFASANQWSSVKLPHEDVAAAGRTLIGRELIAPPLTHLIKPSPPLFSKLLNLHKAICQLAEAAPEVLAGAEIARALEETLIRVMIQCLSEGHGAASRWPIARYSERHPRQRCSARPKTPARKKFPVRPGGFLNLRSQHRFPAPSRGSAAFRQLTCREKECQGAAQAPLLTPMIIRQAWTEYPSISCLLCREANSRPR